MSLMTALQPAKGLTEVAVKGGLSLVESSILGAITVVAVGIAIFAIWKLSRVQDARVSDREKLSSEKDKLLSELITLNNKMTETFSATKSSIDELRSSEREGQEVLRGVRQSLDTVVLEAVKRRR